ncbi:MAG TPA: helix-turn-helix domain-containing protein [Candidatus Thermoplasmatota archaeon]|nr:helix-turn-helix domain-containing protein [Candidatus Thermoplasmatota archaeon]
MDRAPGKAAPPDGGRDDLVASFRALGLGGYEAQAYVALLLAGPSEATALARRAGLPTGRIYDVLAALTTQNLVRLRDERPKVYRAVPAKAAIQTLLAQRRRELDERYEDLTHRASEVEKRLARRMPPGDRDSTFYHVAIGEEAAREYLTARIAEAERELMVSLHLDRYDARDDALFETIRGALDRGVEVRVLMRDRDIPYVLESGYNDLIARTVLPRLGENLHVRVSAREQTPFAVIDGEKVMVGVPHPVAHGAYFAVVFVRDAKFGSTLTSHFGTLWSDADLDLADFAR